MIPTIIFHLHLLAATLPLTASAALSSQQADYSTLHCPPDPYATLVTPSYGTSDAIFTVCSELVIAAPPSTVYAATLDFQSYARWNTFIPTVALPANVSATPADVWVGMAMTFTSRGLVGGLNTTSAEVVSLLDGGGTGYLMSAWRYDDGVGGASARAEHPNVLVDLGDGSTRYLSYETYYAGLSTGAIALLKAQLKEQFDVQARDLKAYVESM
ncbi:hypothetical protein F4781DRAFT_220914 [Annulohypoxylon bovei var. microspora]|nr:hypothetical protein F4781DRAFT_220914 [Annulohypoxylon bovei var. microspora]